MKKITSAKMLKDQPQEHFCCNRDSGEKISVGDRPWMIKMAEGDIFFINDKKNINIWCLYWNWLTMKPVYVIWNLGLPTPMFAAEQ